MATKRGKAKKKNPCWKGYTAMGSDGQIVMKKKGDKMVPACRPIKDGASMKEPRGTKEENKNAKLLKKQNKAKAKDYKKDSKTIQKLTKSYEKNKAKEVAGKITSAKRKEKDNKAMEKANNNKRPSKYSKVIEKQLKK